MAIEKSGVKGAGVVAVAKMESEFSLGSGIRESVSSDDEEEMNVKDSGVDSEEEEDDDDDDEFDDADSGAGSDDFDLLELGETGSEFCQVGDQTCCIPFELYDLADLSGVLSLEVWNDCLTEEERFGLTKYLPDLDQETFMRTLKELFEGGNLHFGNPVDKLYQMLKGGLCEPRVALYRKGLEFFQIHQHYHLLRKHQDSMVTSLFQMREAWQGCKGYSIEEKLRVLNIKRSQRSLMGERNDDMGSDYSDREESGETMWAARPKGRTAGQKAGRDPMYGAVPAMDVFSRDRALAVDVTRSGKLNRKGGPKTVSQNELAQRFQSGRHGHQSIKTGAYGRESVLSRGGNAGFYDGMMASGDDEQEMMYEMASQRNWNVLHGNNVDRGRPVKSGKKREAFRGDEYDLDSYSNPHLSANANFPGQGRNLNINQLSDIRVLTSKPSNIRGLYDPERYDPERKAKYVDPMYEDQMRPVKGRPAQMMLKGNLANYADVAEPYWSKKMQGEAYLAGTSFEYENRDVNVRKMKLGREVPDSRIRTLQALGNQMDGRIYRPEKRAKVFQENTRGASVRNGGPNMFPPKSGRMSHRGEDAESESSDQLEEDEDRSPSFMPNRALSGRLENSRSSLSRSIFDKKEKRHKKGLNESTLIHEGMPHASSFMGDFGRHMQRQNETYYLKSRQNAKTQHLDSLQNFMPRFPEDSYYGGLGNPNAESNRNSAYTVGRNGQIQAELAGSFPMFMNNASPVERRQKGNVGHEFSLRQSKYMRDYAMEQDGFLFEGNPMAGSARDFDATLIGCTSKKQKRKEGSAEMDGQDGSDYMQSHQTLSEIMKSRGKKRPQADSGSPDAGSSELPGPEVGMEEPEPEIKPPKKPSPLVTPTIHTGFSFSVIHLLSAVRLALISPNPENPLEAQKQPENPGAQLEDQAQKQPENLGAQLEDQAQKQPENPGAQLEDQAQKRPENPGAQPEDQNEKHEQANGVQPQIDVNNTGNHEQTSVPSVSVHEIVNRVRSNPGDPCILETQEPLQDLVRGVLKIFSSKTAPLGAKAWKPLISYDRSVKCWSWCGPTPQTSTDNEPPEEVTSPEAWGIPRKMLVKVVDSFANWLKCGQETLQQIGSLPAPPQELMQLNFDEKERFRDLRAQKSLATISPSSDEVRAYFRKEEQLRYSVPDRAFSYTAADGKKSIVAPLRRCGGKPTSKARDHFMLKRDRPPHVTILCLVRDAAARLPGSIGTRADVCTLIRDSQFIVEDVSDAQVNQVVSGALDRLHYERDPCVQFDGERKLWVYLHREREEEDFEDDGTSSTKKWKRQKKDASEQDDQATVACPGSGEPSGLDLSSDLNAEPPCINSDKVVEVIHDDTKQNKEDDTKAVDMPEQLAMLESSLHCLENVKGEDFDDGT